MVTFSCLPPHSQSTAHIPTEVGVGSTTAPLKSFGGLCTWPLTASLTPVVLPLPKVSPIPRLPEYPTASP